MGWETGVSMGASAINAFSTIDNAKAETKAIAQSAEYNSQNIANKTSRNIGTLETSFIRGGIALGGAGGAAESNVFIQAAEQGETDINRTISNANASISNTMNAARTQALTGIAGSFAKLGSGTITNTLSSAWNGLTGNTDPSPGSSVGMGSGTAYTDPSLWGASPVTF